MLGDALDAVVAAAKLTVAGASVDLFRYFRTMPITAFKLAFVFKIKFKLDFKHAHLLVA